MKIRTGARKSTINKTEYLEEIKGNCYFCHKEVNGMFYCFGCRKFVCADCEVPEPFDIPFGPHSIEAHKH